MGVVPLNIVAVPRTDAEPLEAVVVTFLFVGLMELLPKELANDAVDGLRKALAFGAGYGLMAALAVWT